MVSYPEPFTGTRTQPWGLPSRNRYFLLVLVRESVPGVETKLREVETLGCLVPATCLVSVSVVFRLRCLYRTLFTWICVFLSMIQ